MKVWNYLPSSRKPKWKVQTAKGFTLVELLVVIAIIAILAALLLPVLSRVKITAMRAQCMSNMKQVATGMLTFTGDHDNRFPPAYWMGNNGTVSWDTLLYKYLGGGSQPAYELDAGAYANDTAAAAALGLAPGVKIMACPCDTFTKETYVTQSGLAVRSYAMVAASQNWGTGWDVPIQNGLTSTSTRGFMGVGISWVSSDDTNADFEPPGYPDNVVLHPSGTLMLVELANSQNVQGNSWPAFCSGPYTTAGNGTYQIEDKTDQSVQNLLNNGVSEGLQLYPAQRSTFDYVFHDGHVEALPWQQTCVTQTLPGGVVHVTMPSGMWSIQTAQ
jgi:prepilin-type N-terminal cleavage/methylation domain-containing protein